LDEDIDLKYGKIRLTADSKTTFEQSGDQKQLAILEKFVTKYIERSMEKDFALKEVKINQSQHHSPRLFMSKEFHTPDLKSNSKS
jgi:hypothetical protein